ncbi:CAP domain-containing protein [Streptomyces sp. NPDC059165]|uniref:CAP domain-containing protein n=1 Tax=Streptomyces sp. NPDC059165 TaxID=3346751 RepID=UPI003673AACB
MHHGDGHDWHTEDLWSGAGRYQVGRSSGHRAVRKGRHGRRRQAGLAEVPRISTNMIVGGLAAAVVAGGAFALTGNGTDDGTTGDASSAVQQTAEDPRADRLPGTVLPGFTPVAPTPRPPAGTPAAGATKSPTAPTRQTGAPSTGPARNTAPPAAAGPTSPSPSAGTQLTGAAAEYADIIVQLVNLERAKAGCSPVRADALVQAAAQAHADDMAAHGYYEHVSPGGGHANDRMRTAGYPAGKWGENLHRGPSNPAVAMRDWMASPAHRANILDCEFEDVGVGVNLSANGPWWVENFGSRG